MPQRGSIAKKIGLTLACLCIALLGVEAWFRFVHPIEFMRIQTMDPKSRDGWYGMIHRKSSTPGLAYELVPNLDQDSVGAHVKTNSLGMRDDEPLPRSTPGLFRILAVGDSVTFGWRVPVEANFCSLLEQQLAAQPLGARRFEVLNTGVSGYSSQDEAAAFEGKWLALEPDLVLLCYCMNDPEIVPHQPLQRFFIAPSWWQYSSALRYIVQRAEGRKVRELGGGNYFRYLHAPSEPAWKSVEAAFARIAGRSREKHIRVVLAIFPMFSPDPWTDYPFVAQHAQVAKEGERNGFLVLDLLPRFEREDPASLLIDRDDSHPNAGGHQIAASEMQRFLSEHWDEISAGRP